MSKVKVVFRKFKDSGEVIAIFPEINWDAYGAVTSYMHVGQHGGADRYQIATKTVKASPDEYANLLAELKSIGYEPEIINKIRQRH